MCTQRSLWQRKPPLILCKILCSFIATRSEAVVKKADRIEYEVRYGISYRNEPPKMLRLELPWSRGHADHDGYCRRGYFGIRFIAVCFGWTIHPIAKVSEQVNRKCHAIEITPTVQLSTLYVDPERHSAQRYRQTDRHRQTYDTIMPRADHTARSSMVG